MNQNIEIAFYFTKEIPLKNFGWIQNFGGNTNVNRVSFVGWLVVGGWWLVSGWLVVGCVFFAHSDFRVDCIPELHSAYRPRSARK